MHAGVVLVLACAATALVLGCPSKRTDPPGVVVAAPPSAPSESASTPRVRVEVFAVRAGASANAGPSLEVATKLAYTPMRCDPARYLQPAGSASAGHRRRMTLFRVKDVSLVAGAASIVATQGKASPEDDGWSNQEGERAIVIDCTDDIPDATPFPFFFTFVTPAGFDPKQAMLVLEGERVPLAAFVKQP